MPAKSNVKRSVCVPHAAPSSSASAKPRWLLPQKPPSSSLGAVFVFWGLHLLASLAVGKVLNEAASVASAPDGERTPHGGAQRIALAGPLAGGRGGAGLFGCHGAVGVRVRQRD